MTKTDQFFYVSRKEKITKPNHQKKKTLKKNPQI